MNEPQIKIDRRGLLVGGVSILGGTWLLANHARAEGKAETPAPRTLLLLELSGGNDGLSTIVPFAHDNYHRSRTRLGITQNETLRIDDQRGFHPNLKGLRKVWDSGKLAIVEGAGYPNPNHSHFTSQDIWHTARPTGRASGDGWIGRLMASMYAQDRETPHAIHVGQTLPYSLKSSTHPIVCFDTPPAYRWAENGASIAASSMPQSGGTSPLAQIRSVADHARTSSIEVRRAVAQYKPRVEYPNDALGQDLKTAAALLQSNIGCRVLSVTQNGYDTHEDQKRRHDLLMTELDGGLSAFLDDIRGTQSGDDVLVLAFSEFGRRVEDNASMGTDHGTAGPMFVTGTHTKGGLYGAMPSLDDLFEGDLIFTTDFRRVYASVLENWFKVSSEPILGARYETLQGLIA